MSVGSWYVIIVKLLEQSKIGRQAKKTTSQFWNAGSVQQGAENLESTSPFRFIAEPASRPPRSTTACSSTWASMTG
jgi:biopolymer transport protein ExbB